MLDYIIRKSTWYSILPSILFSIVIGVTIAVVVVIILKGNNKIWFNQLAPVAICFSLLGTIVGQIGGFSSVSVTGVIVSGTLSLLTAILIYMLGSKGKRVQIISSMAVTTFAISLVFGLHFGADIRHQRENFELSKEFVERRINNIETVRNKIAIQRLIKESQFNEFKKQLEEKSGVKLNTKYNDAYKPDWNLILKSYRQQ